MTVIESAPAPAGVTPPNVEESVFGELAALRVVVARLLKEVIELQGLGADGMAIARDVNRVAAAKFEFGVDDPKAKARMRAVVMRSLDEMHDWQWPAGA